MPSDKLRTTLTILVLSVAVVAGHLLLGLDQTQIQNGIRNSLHIIVFAGFSYFIFGRFEEHRTWPAVMMTLLIVLIVAGTAELLQFSHGKDPDPADMVRDLVGAGLAIAAHILWRGPATSRPSGSGRGIARTTAIVLAILVFAPLLFWMSVISMNRQAFPSILTFDEWWEPYTFFAINTRIDVQDTGADLRHGQGRAAVFELSRRRRSGISIVPMYTDWSDYTQLSFVAGVAHGPDTMLSVRINDADHYGWYARDLFVERLVTSETATLRIPIDEMLAKSRRAAVDRTDIRQIVILVPRTRAGTRIMLDDFRLE